MKQHILALGAAAALGFAGAAHAVVSFGPGVPVAVSALTNEAPAQATKLEQNAGGIGHMLFAPYFNMQGSTATLINIANTDTKNGKAVKVRFRNASNSDDVLDFTLLLSPGDVWTGTLATNANGNPSISTTDNSCVLPGPDMRNGGVEMKYDRLPGYISDTAKKMLASEGYLEVLNMADIPPGSELYNRIKHKGGVADCSVGVGSVLYELMDASGTVTFVSPTDAATQYGLYAPSGGLMGSWLIQNQSLLNSYSGNMTAIRAVDDDGVPGYTNLIFAPQNGLEIEASDLAAQWGKAIDTQYQKTCADAEGVQQACVAGLTADPLLISNDVVDPLWFDLPDMSTPLLTTTKTPQDQVTGMDLEQNQLFNFFVNDPNGVVPMTTDWVVSQPTRRYYVAVDYNVKDEQGANYVGGLLWNNRMGAGGEGGETPDVVWKKPADTPYDKVVVEHRSAGGEYLGPFACLDKTVATFGTLDNEEGIDTAAPGVGAFSPGQPAAKETLCGEVIVLGFSDQSVFNAQVTRDMWQAEKIPSSGMAQLSFNKQLPLVGFAATSYTNAATGGSYGATMAHRWN